MAKRKELDKETQKIVNYSDKLRGLTQHEGWPLAKEMLYKEVAKLMSVNDVMTISNPEVIIQMIAAKKRAADTLLAWVKEIEGTVAQADGNFRTIDSIVENFIINEEV